MDPYDILQTTNLTGQIHTSDFINYYLYMICRCINTAGFSLESKKSAYSASILKSLEGIFWVQYKGAPPFLHFFFFFYYSERILVSKTSY